MTSGFVPIEGKCNAYFCLQQLAKIEETRERARDWQGRRQCFTLEITLVLNYGGQTGLTHVHCIPVTLLECCT